MFFEVEAFAGIGGTTGTPPADFHAGDGPATEAVLFTPNQITVTPSGVVYVTETLFNGIRKIEGGVVSTLASRAHGNVDGPLSAALFFGPTGIVSDQAGNLYIADQGNHQIRKIDTSGNVTTVAGPSGTEKVSGWVDGRISSNSLFSSPEGIALDAADVSLYILEHNRIRNISIGFSSIGIFRGPRTVAAVGISGFADGPAPVAQFNHPLGIVVTQTGDLFVADTRNCRIRRVTPSGIVTTVAGDGVPAVPTDDAQFVDGRPALHARFERPTALAVDQAGTVWVCDDTHLRMYFPRTNRVSTACSDQRLHQNPLKFKAISGIALSGGRIFVVDDGKVLRLIPHED